MENTSPERRLIPLTQWRKYHSWPPIGGLRHLVFYEYQNGFAKFVRQEKLQEQFDEIIKSFSIDERQYQWMVRGLKEANDTKNLEIAERTTYLNAEIQRLNNRLSQLYEDRLDGIIDKDFYQKKFQEGQERLHELQASLNRLTYASEKQMELGLAILEFSKNAYSLYSQKEIAEQAKLLRIVLSKCELKGGKLIPTYKKPFDMLAKGADFERWYPQGNSNPCLLRERELS